MGSTDYIVIEDEPHPDGTYHLWSERRLVRGIDHVLFSLASVIRFGDSQAAIEKTALHEDLDEDELKALRATNEVAGLRYFEPVVDLNQTPPALHAHVREAIGDMVEARMWKKGPSWRIF